MMLANVANPRMEVEILNKGMTPARDVTYETWIEILPEPFNDFTNRADHFDSAYKTALPPNQTADPLIINIPIREGITDEECRDLKRAVRFACFRILVRYVDAFDSRRCTSFGYMVMINGMTPLPKYNGDCQGFDKRSTRI
jgi:hypothetical protein